MDLASPVDGELTARDVLQHIACTELVEGLRLRRILTEDEPLLASADDGPLVAVFEGSMEASLGAFRAVVLANAARLQRLEEAEWSRVGRNAGGEAYSVDDWLRTMSCHARTHASQLLWIVRSRLN